MVDYPQLLPRHLEAVLRHSLRHFPVVLLVGARQVGKSTLARAVAADRRYLTLDDRLTLDAALRDPDGLVSAAGRAVIDEVQRAPDLLRAIKLSVDRNRTPGRFLLTGSANVFGLARVTETLAGRIAIHELHPFSWAEVRRLPPSPAIEVLFEAATAPAALRGLPHSSPPDRLGELKQLILSGGFPTPALMRSAKARRTWFESYRQTYLERDVRDLANVEHLPEVNRLLAILAPRTSSTLNLAALSRDVGLPVTTLRRYMRLLGLTYQVVELPPYAANVRKRLVKTPKVFYTDTGIASHIAAVDDWAALERRELVGPMVETWAHAEVRRMRTASAFRVDLSFWRTREGREVDLVLERGGELVGVEVKWGSGLDRRALAGLESARRTLGRRWRTGVLLHGGAESIAVDDHTLAMPFGVFFGREHVRRGSR
jgi:hypothetical protein